VYFEVIMVYNIRLQKLRDKSQCLWQRLNSFECKGTHKKIRLESFYN